MATEAQIRANNKSNKLNTTMICVRLSYNTDADIIQKLDEVNSKMGWKHHRIDGRKQQRSYQ